jgi:RNA polymerase sigma-70 factor, ECF subfamily
MTRAPTGLLERTADREIVERLHRKARADRWSLPVEAFAVALEASARKAFAATPGTAPAPSAVEGRQLERYLDSLHVEDLALACACAQGSEPAWEHFIREFRPGLYRAANAIDPSGGSRDLADSLYGELFGLDVRDGERRSHFRYFHGRSSLATWLRAVLSQRHVDRLRTSRRQEPLPEDEAPGAIAAPSQDDDPNRARYVSVMRLAVTAAVAALAPRDRLRLRCYYAQDLTLLQIGRMLNESEATASRHLSRARKEIRGAVERDLSEKGMTDAEMADCFAAVVSDSAYLDVQNLLGTDMGSDPGSDPERKNVSPDRSKSKERSRAGQR